MSPPDEEIAQDKAVPPLTLDFNAANIVVFGKIPLMGRHPRARRR